MGRAVEKMWKGTTFQAYYLQLENLVRVRLENEDADLLQVDFDEYLDFLESGFKWEPLEWDESGKTIKPFSIKRERRGVLDRRIVVEEPWFRLRIPISPHPRRAEYFEFGPSTTRGAEPEWKFEDNALILEVEATEQAVQEGIEAVRFWLGNRNKEIEEGNKHLRDRIRPVWQAKRQQLEDQNSATQSLLEKLNIPLHQDPKARAKPIEIKPRPLRTVMEKPKATAKVEPTLNREGVIGLVDFIEQFTRQFEVTPRNHATKGEENLRNDLVAMINTSYPGTTTAETFSKLG
ncbi:MAG: hypothetical protein Q8P59_00170, partial [Dehalococcoidia bacterium]|nr:hypothetical protein [Dehalococcoidia bacterium]